MEHRGAGARGSRPGWSGWILLAAMLATAACGGKAPAGNTTPAGNGTGTGTQPSESDPAQAQDPEPREPAFLEASGAAETEAEAYELAVAALARELHGDAPWAAGLDVPVHDPELDPVFREHTEDVLVHVIAGIERERVEALLVELATAPLPSTIPPALAPALEPWYRGYIESAVCQRRQVLLEDTCEAAPSEELAAELQAIAGEIRLRTRLAGGIPLDADSQPLRPLEVIVERVSASGVATALPGVPLKVVQPEGVDVMPTTEAVTGEAGLARFAFRLDATWPSGVRVVLDREALLGPLAEMWPTVELAPAGRPASVRRWSVVVTERVQGHTAREGVFAASLDQAMRGLGSEPMVTLTPDAVRAVQSAQPADLGQVLRRLADELQGRVDVLVLVELDSEYASRMGAYRVWYEARGRAQVLDVWTGEELAALQDSVTATGVGDERADRAARSELAEKLAPALARIAPVTR